MIRVKGIKDNSKIKDIGSFFKKISEPKWRINVDFDTQQNKHYLDVSQATIVARKMVINATEPPPTAGYAQQIRIDNSGSWSEGRVSDFLFKKHINSEYGRQWCFIFEQDGVRFYLPHFELARALFFHNAYMSRLAMMNAGISKDFDVIEKPEAVEIHILPTATIPNFARQNAAFRNLLSWIILDPGARASFDSIYQHLQNEQYIKGNYYFWDFHFAAPPLKNTKLDVRGHFDQEKKLFFVYQITAVEMGEFIQNKPIIYFDPNFIESTKGNGTASSFSQHPEVEMLIDEEESPSASGQIKKIEIEPIVFKFPKSFSTKRKGEKSRSQVSSVLDTTDTSSDGLIISVNTDENLIQGSLPAADFDGIDEHSGDMCFYLTRFDAFSRMLDKLLTIPDCSKVALSCCRLPAVKRCKMHLFADGNPRCIVVCIVEKSGTQYALLEVDASDSQAHLSTLLIKQPFDITDWNKYELELKQLVVQQSLSWPSSYLNKTIKNQYRRLSHPKSALDGSAVFDIDAVERWAERIYNAMD